jgi:quercetin dioxygenase-like cupin family protein
MNNENYCFCELAPLYVLDLLNDSERLWVEEQLIEHPELAEELAEYATAVTAIPYGVNIVPMAENLEDRLFASLELPQSPSEPILQSPGNILPSLLSIRKEDMHWQPHRIPGVEIAILRRDEIQREIIGLFRAAPGVTYPLHRHATDEDIFMLEGDLLIEDKVYGAFDYIHSEAGSVHAPHTNGGCMFFFRTSMDNQYDFSNTQNPALP